MPYRETKLRSGKVRVSSPNRVHAKATTKAKADAQMRLLNAIEHNPDFHPRGSVSTSKRKRKTI